jgi:RNA polymerase sigma-70 factor (ECF subfamily)
MIALAPASYPWRRMVTARPDPELAGILGGDEAEFEALFKRYHGPLLRLAMSYLGDRDSAEDAVQETWLTCLRSLDRFEGRSSFKTWLFGILVNLCRSRLRRRSRLIPFSSLLRRDGRDPRRPTVDPDRFGTDGSWTSIPDSWAEVPEEKLLGRETQEMVLAAIDALPAKQREVILLRDVAGWSAEEVRTLLEISDANQRVRLHRARTAVRSALEEYLA